MKKPCLKCGVPTQDSTCPPCLATLPVRRRTENAPKPSSTQRGYDKAWRDMARSVLVRDHWTCQVCGVHLGKGTATVDHIIPVSLAPHLRLDPSNLRAACRSCNSRKRDRL